MCDEEDESHGYRIPKGAMILPSIKRFSMDPDVYPELETFQPERFVGSDPAPSPSQYVFGFGRRVCLGRILADANLFLLIAQTLAVFEIQKAANPDTGEELEPMAGIGRGLVED
jgi:cytochrome P450